MGIWSEISRNEGVNIRSYEQCGCGFVVFFVRSRVGIGFFFFKKIFLTEGRGFSSEELPNKACLIVGTPTSCDFTVGFVKVVRQWDCVRVKYQTRSP